MAQIIKEDGKTIVKTGARIDTLNAAQFEAEIQPALEQGVNLEFDCTELVYMSSSGLRIFITIRKAATEKGGKVIVRSISNEIRAVFMMTGFLNLFEIE